MKSPRTLGFHVLGTVLVAVGTALPAWADYESTVLSQGPVGYWRLNETIAPVPAASAANLGSLGSGSNGIYTNYPTRGLPGPFAGSLALNFDGLSQKVFAPYAAELNPAVFTIEAWLNPETATPAGNLRCVMASMHSDDPRSGWLIYQSGGPVDTTAPGWELRLYAESGTATSLRLLVTNTVTPGTWYHLVYTFDGTTAKGYLNGKLANQGNPTGFVPNPDAPFTVGARSDDGFPWAGQSAEVAYYGAALTGDQIKAHYDAANTNASGYPNLITGNSPLVYYRFREPADPVAANAGSLGSVHNGLYIYNANPGVAGPLPPALQGFDAANKAVGFDGVGGGVVQIPPLNLNTNTVTITTWINAKGAQNPATGLVFSRAGGTVAGLNIDATQPAGLFLGYTWNADPNSYNWSPNTDADLPALPDSQWAFAALVVSSDKASIYLGDPSNAAAFTGVTNYITHGVQDFSGATLFGADNGFTPTRFLNGALDEVAIFDRSLSAGEVFSQFATGVGGLAPKIFADPQSPADLVYAGDELTLSVDAGGTPILTYQWRKNGTDISGATNSAYTIPTLVTGDAGNYDVIITNQYGSKSSAAASITVNTMSAPTITQDIQGRTIYIGGTLKLSVAATGGALTYQWQKDGAPLGGATNPTYLVSSVAAVDAGDYKVVVSNILSTATSATAKIVVVSPVAGSYEAVVIGDAPISWWRLDEPGDSPLMLDSMARNDGYYTNVAGNPVTLGVPGVIAGNSAASSDGSDAYFGVVPYSSQLGSAAFTFECWAKVPDSAANYCPISFYEQSRKGSFMYSDSGAGSWRMGIGAGGDPPLFYYLGDVTGANIVPDKWMQLVMTCDGSSVRWYANGQQSQGYLNFARNVSNPLLIGGIGPAINYKFKGTVDEVVFYTKALSQAQVQAHYVAAVYPNGSAPVFTIQPTSQAVVFSNNVSFTALAEGTLGITYQWLKDGDVLVNQTDNTLNLSKVAFTDVGNYQIRAVNSVGTNLSSVATLSVYPLPAFANATNGLVLHLRFEGDYADSSGLGNNGTAVGSPTFVSGKIGSQALNYSTDTTNNTYNYVTLGTLADLQFSSNVNFSVAYWVRLPAGSFSGDLPFLCTAINSYGNQGMTFAPSYQAGGWSFSLNGNAQNYGDDGSINDGKWHSLVHTFDRLGNGVTYLDGVEVDSQSLANVGDLSNSNPAIIGQDPSGRYAESGTADLDDLGVWRRALTPGEATAIYFAGVNGTSFDTYGPVTVNLTQAANQLIISWQAGTLVESSSADGPWTPVAGATAPNYKVTPGTGNKFYRIQL